MQLIQRLKSKIEQYRFRSDAPLANSDVFCMAPWIQLHAQTNGKAAPCCMSSIKDGNEIGDLRTNPNLATAWNSANVKQLRLNMLNGKKSSICNNCYEHEKIGKKSERHQYNNDFVRYYQRVKNTLPDGTVTERQVPVINLRFSNKCNYKCRICNSDYSTLWYEEEIKLGLTPLQKDMKPVADEKMFWESFKEMLPGVERLHFAGGEPLFMDEHYEVLEHLIAIGKTDINLTYNTNFSTLRYKKHNVIELWNKFKKVDVWASLDGMGERGDYQRKGQKWGKIEENIREVNNECKTVCFGVNATVSIFNVLHIPEFYRHMLENKLVQAERMNLYPLYFPHAFSIANLTPALKQQVIDEYKNFENTFLKSLPANTPVKNHLKAIVTYLKSEEKNLKAEFQQKINAVDEIRNEKFAEVFPELAEMMVAIDKVKI